jgi:hypothetical protein
MAEVLKEAKQAERVMEAKEVVEEELQRAELKRPTVISHSSLATPRQQNLHSCSVNSLAGYVVLGLVPSTRERLLPAKHPELDVTTGGFGCECNS